MDRRRSQTPQSVERAIMILKSFNIEKPERGVNELSRELDIHKSTVSRLVLALERGGLLSLNPQTGRYRLGVDLIGLGAQVVSHLDAREIARPYLQEMAGACRETVNLSVLDGMDVINLEQFVPKDRQVRSIGWVGRRTPPHCTAAGKVLLAYLPQHDLTRFLQRSMQRYTSNTITDPDELRRELNQARRQGYAVAQEELEEGLNVIAAPFRDHTGRVVGAISLSGPSSRLEPDMFPQIAARLTATAQTISQNLGFRK
jgi:DNA-binding IclR family transcriptional regulator